MRTTFILCALGAVLLAACGGSDSESLFEEGASGGAGASSGDADAASGADGSGGTSSSADAGAGGPSAGAGGVNSGGVSAGGTSAGGGGVEAGGAGGLGSQGGTGTGGGTADGGAGGGPRCPDQTKSCGGVCVVFSPVTGCSPSDCNPCPPPPHNGTGICDGERCSFECAAGFVPSGSSCVEEACDPARCPACANQVPCCTLAGSCSCRFQWNPTCS